LENFSFTIIDAEEYTASEKWQKILICIFLIAKGGAAVEY
jgi:hypothetical protein